MTDPLIERVWTQLKELLSDPSQEFRQEVIGIANMITKDFKNIRETEGFRQSVIITNEGEDKGLERILKILDKADVIVGVMKGVSGGEKEVLTPKKSKNGRGGEPPTVG